MGILRPSQIKLHSAGRPKEVFRMARFCVAAFAKGTTLACKPHLDPNHPEGSEYGFI